ncbi:MAG: hypothetical protein HY921_10710 [Elusimicrobia bacterium]|nr:hypothetical protein [Elusimicrobiota bacterium]
MAILYILVAPSPLWSDEIGIRLKDAELELCIAFGHPFESPEVAAKNNRPPNLFDTRGNFFYRAVLKAATKPDVLKSNDFQTLYPKLLLWQEINNRLHFDRSSEMLQKLKVAPDSGKWDQIASKPMSDLGTSVKKLHLQFKGCSPMQYPDTEPYLQELIKQYESRFRSLLAKAAPSPQPRAPAAKAGPQSPGQSTIGQGLNLNTAVGFDGSGRSSNNDVAPQTRPGQALGPSSAHEQVNRGNFNDFYGLFNDPNKKFEEKLAGLVGLASLQSNPRFKEMQVQSLFEAFRRGIGPGMSLNSKSFQETLQRINSLALNTKQRSPLDLDEYIKNVLSRGKPSVQTIGLFARLECFAITSSWAKQQAGVSLRAGGLQAQGGNVSVSKAGDTTTISYNDPSGKKVTEKHGPYGAVEVTRENMRVLTTPAGGSISMDGKNLGFWNGGSGIFRGQKFEVKRGEIVLPSASGGLAVGTPAQLQKGQPRLSVDPQGAKMEHMGGVARVTPHAGAPQGLLARAPRSAELGNLKPKDLQNIGREELGHLSKEQLIPFKDWLVKQAYFHGPVKKTMAIGGEIRLSTEKQDWVITQLWADRKAAAYLYQGPEAYLYRWEASSSGGWKLAGPRQDIADNQVESPGVLGPMIELLFSPLQTAGHGLTAAGFKAESAAMALMARLKQDNNLKEVACMMSVQSYYTWQQATLVKYSQNEASHYDPGGMSLERYEKAINSRPGCAEIVPKFAALEAKALGLEPPDSEENMAQALERTYGIDNLGSEIAKNGDDAFSKVFFYAVGNGVNLAQGFLDSAGLGAAKGQALKQAEALIGQLETAAFSGPQMAEVGGSLGTLLFSKNPSAEEIDNASMVLLQNVSTFHGVTRGALVRNRGGHAPTPSNGPSRPRETKSLPIGQRYFDASANPENLGYLDWLRKHSSQEVRSKAGEAFPEGFRFTPEQQAAIEAAHKVGLGKRGYGSFTQQEMLEKGRILARAGLNAKQRELILWTGRAGGNAPSAHNAGALNSYETALKNPSFGVRKPEILRFGEVAAEHGGSNPGKVAELFAHLMNGNHPAADSPRQKQVLEDLKRIGSADVNKARTMKLWLDEAKKSADPEVRAKAEEILDYLKQTHKDLLSSPPAAPAPPSGNAAAKQEAPGTPAKTEPTPAPAQQAPAGPAGQAAAQDQPDKAWEGPGIRSIAAELAEAKKSERLKPSSPPSAAGMKLLSDFEKCRREIHTKSGFGYKRVPGLLEGFVNENKDRHGPEIAKLLLLGLKAPDVEIRRRTASQIHSAIEKLRIQFPNALMRAYYLAATDVDTQVRSHCAGSWGYLKQELRAYPRELQELERIMTRPQTRGGR